MNIKRLFKYCGLLLFAFVLSGCQTVKNANKPFKHNTPLIKENIAAGSSRTLRNESADDQINISCSKGLFSVIY